MTFIGITACTLGKSLRGPSTPEASGSVVTSTDRSGSFRLERACLPGGSRTR